MAFWGSFPSCYDTLTDEHVAALEGAVRLQVLGQYREAELAFQDLCLQTDTLLIGIERAILYEQIGLERKKAEILDLAINSGLAVQKYNGTALWDLAKLLRINAGYYAYGIAKPGLKESAAIARRLVGRDIAQITDVEARCLLECLKYWRLCQDISNWVENPQEGIQQLKQDLPSIAQLRVKMQQQNRYMTAHQLVRLEGYASDYSDLECVDAQKDFLTSAQHLEDLEDEVILTKLGTTRIFYAGSLVGIGQIQEAREQIEHAKRLLERAASSATVSSKVSPRLQLLLARAEAKIDSKLPLAAQVAQDLALAEAAHRIPDFAIQRFHHRTAMQKVEALLAQSDTPRETEEWLEQYRNLMTQYMDRELDDVRGASFYVGALTIYGADYVVNTGRKPSDFLPLVAEVDQIYPRFDHPQPRLILMELASTAASRLGNPDLAAKYNKAAQKAYLECPGVSITPQGTIEYENLSDENYITEWQIDDYSQWCESYMTISSRILLSYIRTEASRGLLTVKRIEALIGWQRHPPDEVALPLDLDAICPMTLRNVVFGRRNANTGKTEPVDPNIWDPWMDNVEEWLLEEDRPPSRIQRQHLLYQIMRCRAQSLSDYSLYLEPGDEPLKGDNRQKKLAVLKASYAASQRCFHTDKILDSKVVSRTGRRTTELIIANKLVGLALLATADEKHGVTEAMLSDSINTFDRLEKEYLAEGDLVTLSHTSRAKAQALLRRWLLFGSGEPSDCLPALTQSVRLYHQLRLENVVGTPSRSFLAKTYLAENLFLKGVYQQALFACVLAYTNAGDGGTHASKRLAFEIFSWTQRSKAQALTDLMGLVAQVPASLMEPIKADADALRLLDEETAITKRLQEASPLQRIPIRDELQQHMMNMHAKSPVLRPLLDVRSGTSISTESLQRLGDELGSKVIIFEWVSFAPNEGAEGDLLIMVYKKGQIHDFVWSSVKPRQVQLWVANELDSPPVANRPLATGPGALKALAGLVEPVLDYSEPGDTLIFCPTGELHRIPLHAISPRNTLLIERNPVHYCQSLSLLRLCHQSQQGFHQAATFKASVFNTLNTETGILGESPQKFHIDEISGTLDTETIQQQNITKDLFRQRGKESFIMHVHGHINFDPENPLHHHLVLRDPPKVDDDRYTADEIFDTPFCRPALILAMGCNGGRSKTFECDDLLGLTAAFHYSGASSVISTLWKVNPTDCMRFSKAFYFYLVESMYDGNDEEETVDLALAFQKAVIDARRNEKGRYLAPYSWAAFYLHGSGRFPRFRLPKRSRSSKGIEDHVSKLTLS